MHGEQLRWRVKWPDQWWEKYGCYVFGNKILQICSRAIDSRITQLKLRPRWHLYLKLLSQDRDQDNFQSKGWHNLWSQDGWNSFHPASPQHPKGNWPFPHGQVTIISMMVSTNDTVWRPSNENTPQEWNKWSVCESDTGEQYPEITHPLPVLP